MDRGNYGAITQISDISEQDARSRIQLMYHKYGITDFQFYDVFESYSVPGNGDSWKSKSRTMIENKDVFVLKNILEAYTDEIKKLNCRAWLYVQAIGADEPALPPHTKLDDPHTLWDNKILFHCYLPTTQWAARMVDIWAPFAQQFAFYGIHWDSLGHRNGLPEEIFSEFLRETHTRLNAYNLKQTFNAVNAFGYDRSLFTDNILEFPYCELWDDKLIKLYLEELNTLPKEKKGIIVWYPHGSHNKRHRDPWVVRNIVHDYRLYDNCTGLLIADGNRLLKTEYFPNTEKIPDGLNFLDV